jgi:hypothetical protein
VLRILNTAANQCCEAGAEEPKLNCLPEPDPKLQIAAPALAPFILTPD